MDRIAELVRPCVDRRFRGEQVARWIHQRGAQTFSEMTDLPLALRAHLAQSFSLSEPSLIATVSSRDGSMKHVMQLADGATIEAVIIPERNRTTICVSSQTGCALNCRFCSTALLGAGRNLTSAEIVGQLRLAVRGHHGLSERLNVVFMGMGEPLLNRANLRRAIEALSATVSMRRVTVSTAGVVPGIHWLASWTRRPQLAVSLNAPTQELRAEFMPIAERYPMDELMAALRTFPLEGGRRITFEYVLIRGVNDAPGDARALGKVLAGIPAKMNVIPFNPDPERLPGMEAPLEAEIDGFVASLPRRRGFAVTVRRSRGQDIGGACGQLTGLVRTTSDHCRPAAAPSRRKEAAAELQAVQPPTRST